ncbi:MAG: hypothetical protein FWE68_05240 [Defluviitaleaceae bacterium]|nr:hypothetical protein [Defluviitaleaceae bacterium]
MSAIAQRITDMIDLLPEDEQALAYEIVKRMVLAWDPEFTKATPDESESIRQARAEYERGECISFASAEEMAAHFGV